MKNKSKYDGKGKKKENKTWADVFTEGGYSVLRESQSFDELITILLIQNRFELDDFKVYIIHRESGPLTKEFVNLEEAEKAFEEVRSHLSKFCTDIIDK